MENSRDLGENVPVAGEELGAHGAPVINPAAQLPLCTAPLQGSGGACSSSSD